MKGKTARTSLAVNMTVSEASCRMEANEAEGPSELGEEHRSTRSFMRTTVAPRALFHKLSWDVDYSVASPDQHR